MTVGKEVTPSSHLPGFYRLSREQRVRLLVEKGWLEPREADVFFPKEQNAPTSEWLFLDRCSENVLGRLALPLGIVTHMVVNGQDRLVPMATEEPSVVAACCRAARVVRGAGGVTAQAGDRQAEAQVMLRTTQAEGEVREWVRAHERAFIMATKKAHPRLTKAGGGVHSLSVETPPGLPESLVVLIRCHCADAMGANLVMSVGERLRQWLKNGLEPHWSCAIVTNEPAGRVATARVQCPVEHLATDQDTGEQVAERIAFLSAWAHADAKRGITHNKGILNGVTALFTALYQDTRAPVVALSVWGSSPATPWTSWKVQEGVLEGRFQGPLPCGTAGGTGPHGSCTALFHRWMRVTRATDLEEVAAGVALLQNMGALRAMATRGVYRGHIGLHMRKIREPQYP